MASLDLGRAMEAAFGADPASVPDVVREVAKDLGATDVVAYLVDFAQRSLSPLPMAGAAEGAPDVHEVTATMAGRAFTGGAPVVAVRADGDRIWVPVIEGSDRTGVLAVTVPRATPEVVEACQELGRLAGYLIATHARSTDVYDLHRRRQRLSLAASMQWDLLPPLVLRTSRVTVAGLLEPAYEVGGDCFDYAVTGDRLELGMFDPMGHGTQSALIAALCIGSYRHDRRERRTMAEVHRHLDQAIEAQMPGTFATGQLVRLDLDDGGLSWTNAGHPAPMLVRGGRVIKELRCPPTPPWGLGGLLERQVVVATEALEPGDAVLLYTDGVTEAHLPGQEQFGAERLADLLGQQAADGAEPDELVRRLVRAVLEHQDDRLADDATLVLVQWHGPGPASGRRGDQQPR